MIRTRNEPFVPRPCTSINNAVATGHACAHIRSRRKFRRKRDPLENFNKRSSLNVVQGYESIYKRDRFKSYAAGLCSNHRSITPFGLPLAGRTRKDCFEAGSKVYIQATGDERKCRRQRSRARNPDTPPEMNFQEMPKEAPPLSAAYTPVKRIYLAKQEVETRIAKPRQKRDRKPKSRSRKIHVEDYFSAWHEITLFAWKRRQLIGRITRHYVHATLERGFEALRAYSKSVPGESVREPCKCIAKFARVAKNVQSSRIHDALAPVTQSKIDLAPHSARNRSNARK